MSVAMNYKIEIGDNTFRIVPAAQEEALDAEVGKLKRILEGNVKYASTLESPNEITALEYLYGRCVVLQGKVAHTYPLANRFVGRAPDFQSKSKELLIQFSRFTAERMVELTSTPTPQPQGQQFAHLLALMQLYPLMFNNGKS